MAHEAICGSGVVRYGVLQRSLKVSPAWQWAMRLGVLASIGAALGMDMAAASAAEEPPKAVSEALKPEPESSDPPANMEFWAAPTPGAAVLMDDLRMNNDKPVGAQFAPQKAASADDGRKGETGEGRPPGVPPPRVKGDLVYVGTREFLSPVNHFGVRAGPNIIGSQAYALVDPGFAWYFDDWGLSLHAPLNFLVFDTQSLAYGGFKLRAQDWDEPADYLRVVRFITIGAKESPLFISLNALRPTRLGHGMLINKYQGNIDIDRAMTGLIVDYNHRYAGFQFQANDVTLTNQIFGALAYVKPLAPLFSHRLLRSFSLGVEYAGDLRAPRCILRERNLASCVQGSGHSAGVDPFTGVELDETFVRSDRATGRIPAAAAQVHALGFSGESKVWARGRADLKAYVTGHKFINARGGDGEAIGLLGRATLGDEWLNAFRVRVEYNTFSDGFWPAYFDTFYEVSKYQHTSSSGNYQVTPTRFQGVFGDPENGFARPTFGRSHGFRMDASWALFHWRRSDKKIAIGFGFRDTSRPDDSTLYIHAEIPALRWLQLHGTLMRFNASNPRALFSKDFFSANNSVILSGLRLMVIPPVLFLNVNYAYTQRIVRSPGSEYHLGNASVVDATGNPSPNFPQDNLFEAVSTLSFTLEFGWEFLWSKPRDPKEGSES